MSKVLGLILSAMMVASVVLAAATDDKEAEAIDAGRQWLSLCDQAKYGESWETAATYFKNAVKKEQWEQMAARQKAVGESGEKGCEIAQLSDHRSWRAGWRIRDHSVQHRL